MARQVAAVAATRAAVAAAMRAAVAAAMRAAPDPQVARLGRRNPVRTLAVGLSTSPLRPTSAMPGAIAGATTPSGKRRRKRSGRTACRGTEAVASVVAAAETSFAQCVQMTTWTAGTTINESDDPRVVCSVIPCPGMGCSAGSLGWGRVGRYVWPNCAGRFPRGKPPVGVKRGVLSASPRWGRRTRQSG